jgi:hypothetical protein
MRLCRRGVDLALVDPLVLVPGRLDEQEPLVGLVFVKDSEPRVSRVDELAHCQQTHVAITNPRDLKRRLC